MGGVGLCNAGLFVLSLFFLQNVLLCSLLFEFQTTVRPAGMPQGPVGSDSLP